MIIRTFKDMPDKKAKPTVETQTHSTANEWPLYVGYTDFNGNWKIEKFDAVTEHGRLPSSWNDMRYWNSFTWTENSNPSILFSHSL